MIASVHLAAPGPRRSLAAFRAAPDPAAVAGLGYSETVLPAPLGPAVIPKPSISEIGLIASWEDDEHLDRFLADPALAGSFAAQDKVPVTAGTLPTHRPQFVGLLIGTIVIVSALTYLPVLALGPLAEGLK